MKIALLPVGLLLVLMSCNHTSKSVKTNTVDTSDSMEKTKAPIANQPADEASDRSWTDSLLTLYTKQSHNGLVEAAVGDTAINEEWTFDRVEQRGKTKYFVYNVGHEHNNGESVVFASDSWVFIDSLSHKLYEYQPDESLIEWKR